MSKKNISRDLYSALHEQGLLEYGSVIERAYVHEIIGVEMPLVAPKQVFDRIALAELTAVDYVRNILLGQGKYLMGTPTGYKVLLPSENAAQIEQYIGAADNKLARALKLSRSSPVLVGVATDQTEARIMMKRKSVFQDREGARA